MNFLKTFAKFSAGTWVQAVLSLISTPVIAWFITPDDFGKSSMFILAYKLIFNVILLGCDQSFARYYHDNEQPATLLRIVLVPVFIFSTLVTIVIEIFRKDLSLLLFGNLNCVNIIHLLPVTLISGVLIQLGVVSIRMQSKALRFSLVQVVQAVVNFMTVLLYAKFVRADFSAVIIALVLSQVFGFILTIAYDHRIWTNAISGISLINKEKLKQVLIYGLPFVPTFLLDWVFQGADRTFLRLYSDFTQIGIYSTAAKIALSLNIIQVGFTTFWLPYSLERFRTKPDDTQVYSTIFNILTMAFAVLVLLFIVFHKVILMLLPQGYSGVVIVFPLLMFIPMLYTISEVTAVGINFKAKTVQHLYVIIISVIFNVITAYLFIPHWGALGAAAAMFIGYIAFFISRTYFGMKNFYAPLHFKKFSIAFLLILFPVLFTVFTTGSLYLTALFSLACIVKMYYPDFKDIKAL